VTASVVITGLGFVTSIGHSRQAVSRSLRSLAHGLSPWRPVADVDLDVKVGGLLSGFDLSSSNPAAWSWPEEFELDPATSRAMPPHGVYALAAVQQAVEEAHLSGEELSDGATGLFCASAGSPRMMCQHLEKLRSSGWRRAHPHAVISSVAGSLNFHLAALLGIRGASCGFVSACSSGSHALGYAMDEIRLGRQERIIVVAAEDLNAEATLPFSGMGALSTQSDPRLASRPFDRGRDGFVATGGAAALILESMPSAEARGVRPLARMLGWGQSCDGHHVAMPHPDGLGVRDAMRMAMRDAGVSTDEVGYINAHAPSTPAGDRAESRAIGEVFQGFAPPVSSTKALTGHGLSLAGAMEAGFCVLALDEGFIPGQAHLVEPDEDSATLHLPSTTLEQQPGVALNNSSGFGGSNVVHVYSSMDYRTPRFA
jgi:3-oxoacyl-[acyl-carrier-protein] synthase I